MDLFIRINFDGCESLPTQGPLPRKEVSLDINLSSAQYIYLLLSMDLGKHLLGRVDLPDELVSDGPLELLGPVAEEEDARLDELELGVAGHICISRRLPCRTSSLSLSRNEFSSSTLNLLLAIWLFTT